MAEIDQTIASQVRVPTPPDVVGPISSLAQMQYWAAQGQKAAADASLVQQQTRAAQAGLAARQGAVSAIQGGATPEDAINSSGLGIFDPGGASATLANVTSGNTIKANRAYAAANPNSPLAIAGPGAVAEGFKPAQAAADVQKTSLANSDVQTQLYGKIGTMMAADPSPQGRAATIAYAKSINAPPDLIAKFAALPDDQWVAAGRHFQAASMAPDRYMDVSGQTDQNKGLAAANTTVQKLAPGERIVAGPGAAAVMAGKPAPSFAASPGPSPVGGPLVPNNSGPPIATDAQGRAINPKTGQPTQAVAPGSPPAPAQGPNYIGLTAQKESGNNPSIVNAQGNGGLFQFSPKTWAGVAKAHPDLGLSPNGYSDGSQAGVQQQIAAMKAFTADNAAQLSSSGIQVNDKSLRMAHFLGVGGATQFFKAANQDPNASAASVFPAEAKANPTLFYANGTQPRTLSQLYDVVTRGFGNGLTANVAPGAGTLGMTPGAPLAQPGGSPPPTAAPMPQLSAPPVISTPAPAWTPEGQAPSAAGGTANIDQLSPDLKMAVANGSIAPGGASPPAAPLIPPGSSTPTAAAAVTQPNGGLTTIAQGMSKSALAEQEAQGKNYGELPAQLDSAANSAKTMNNTLDEMTQAADGSWQQGKWAPVQEHMREGLQSIAHTLGVTTPGLDKSIESYQDFSKLAGNISRQASHETSSRVGVQEMQLINKSLPNPEMSPGGFKIVASQLKALNDFAIAKQQAAAQWRSANGNSLGPMPQSGGKDFQAIWNDNASPAAFVVHRMAQENPEALQTALTAMKSTPAGKAALDKIIAQTKWAHDAGLLQ